MGSRRRLSPRKYDSQTSLPADQPVGGAKLDATHGVKMLSKPEIYGLLAFS